MPVTDSLTLARAALSAQPFSVMLGAELTAWSESGAELQLAINPSLLQQYGIVHGGVLSYLADNALTFAGAWFLQGAPVTPEMKINYTRPAVGERLIARATAVSCGVTQAVARCDVFALRDGREHLCAAAQGTIVVPAGGRSVAATPRPGAEARTTLNEAHEPSL